MAKRDKDTKIDEIDSLTRDNLHELDPEVAHLGTLRMGGTPEEAEQSASG